MQSYGNFFDLQIFSKLFLQIFLKIL